MMDKRNLDKKLRYEFNNNFQEISTQKNLFAEAWSKKDSLEFKTEGRYFVMSKRKIAALALGACILIGGISLGFSPSVRASVSTLFGLDSNGNVIEETEDTLSGLNSALYMDDSNESDIEDLLGFKISFPEKVGDYRSISSPIPGISIKDVKNKDIDALADELKNTTDIKETAAKLREDYEISFFVGTFLLKDSTENGISMNIDQQKGDKVKIGEDCTIKSVEDVDGVECTIYDHTDANGNEAVERGEDGAIIGIKTDKTKKPETTTRQNVVFSYKGIIYTISGDYKENNDDEEMDFVKEYIEILKAGK